MDISKKNTTFSLLQVMLFSAFLVGILTTGYYFYYDFREKYLEEQKKTLNAVGKYRSDEIVQWRKERFGDAVVIYQNTIFADLVKRVKTKQNEISIYNQLNRWLTALQYYNQYNCIEVIDINGNQILSIPEKIHPPSSIITKFIRQTPALDSIVVVDFYKNEFDLNVYLSIIIPVIDNDNASRVLGFVHLRIDPDDFLFPLMKRSMDLEMNMRTLIVRREHDSVAFLTHLDFSKNTSLNYRISLRETSIVSVQCVLGKRGIIEGIDYAKNPVIAYVNNIEGSPWYIVVKINRQIIESELREYLWFVIAAIILLIAGCGGIVGMYFRKQKTEYFREKYHNVKEREFLQEVIQHSLNEIYIIDPQTLRITFANDGAVKHLGYTINELSAKKVSDINPDFDEESFRRLVRPLLEGEEKLLQFETLHQRCDGTHYPVEVHLQLATMEDGVVLLAMVNDITERKTAEAKIQYALKELHRSNKELEQFAYVASHDLQEPLRMVASYTQLLERRYKGKLDTDADEFIRYAVEGANRMQKLINDLLEYSRVSTRGKVFNTTDLNSVLGEVIADLHQKIDECNAIVTNTELPTIIADAGQIKRLLQNLIDNALKYRKPSKLTVVNISSVERTNEYEFMVKDNGIGIDPKFQERIFVIFQRLHTREEYSGSGIGLAICKRIAERHGGKIWFESVPGEGTAFHVTVSKQLVNESL